MYLVDTSIWIDYFREKNNNGVNYFESILEQKIPFGITSIIFQEILQGAYSRRDFNKLTEYLESQIFFNPKDSIVTYKNAAELYFNCRRKGITVRSSIDCLIAEIAIEHDLILLHNDNDYIKIRDVQAQLRLADTI